DLHRWSTEHRAEFWSAMIERLGIVFRTKPETILEPNADLTHPDWLPGASLNVAESCFRAEPGKTAIVFASEAIPEPRRVTYGELHRLAVRVANGLSAIGTKPGDRVALYLPMTPESVGIYLGVVLAGCCVVGIADASAPADFAKRSGIAEAKLVFTVDAYLRDGKEHPVYGKVTAAHGPRAVVLGMDPETPARTTRSKDLGWTDFLPDKGTFDAVPCRPSDPSNILFSSGTTKDPKAIPWTHTTPIKAAADAYLHHDVGPSDVLAWPTSFGWMMGPWLTYGALVNRATMALYVGSTTRRAFGEFVSQAGVTMLSVVPKLVRAWKLDGTMDGLDWSRIRRFSSTAEPSSPEDMLNLNGVKTSAEEIRSVIGNDLVADAKPISVDTDGSGQHRLVVYAVPRDLRLVESPDLPERLRTQFQRDIKERLNPLLAHVEEVVLEPELPQAGPGKTKTMQELRRDHEA